MHVVFKLGQEFDQRSRLFHRAQVEQLRHSCRWEGNTSPPKTQNEYDRTHSRVTVGNSVMIKFMKDYVHWH